MSTTTIVVNCSASKKRRVEEEDTHHEEESIGSQDSERSEDEESTIADREFVEDESASMQEWAEQHMKVVYSSYHSQQRNEAFMTSLKQLISTFNSVKVASGEANLPEWYLDMFDSLLFELIKAERAVVVEKRRK